MGKRKNKRRTTRDPTLPPDKPIRLKTKRKFGGKEYEAAVSSIWGGPRIYRTRKEAESMARHVRSQHPASSIRVVKYKKGYAVFYRRNARRRPY